MTNLALPAFSDLTADNLKADVLASLEAANTLLDTFEASTANSPKQALSDIETLEVTEQALERAWGLLSHLNSVTSSDALREARDTVLPELSTYGTRLGQCKPLYERYKSAQGDAGLFAELSQARKRSIALAIQGFELSGVALPADKKVRFGELNAELSKRSAKFSDNVLDATQAYQRVLTDGELDGITPTGLVMLQAAGSAYKIEQGIEDDEDIYVATLDIPVYLAIMTHAKSRTLREEIYRAYVTRASSLAVTGDKHDNADNMLAILQHRAEKAYLLGFDNYAQVSLATKMAGSSSEVVDFLEDLAARAKAPAHKDLALLQAEATALDIHNIKPWDTAYLAEIVKNKKFNLSQEALRPYFALPKVLAGLFSIVEKLYGIGIRKAQADTWHQDVQYFELYENDALIGGFYFDLYARSGKRGGAWMSGFQSRMAVADMQRAPVCFMVCNFTPPVDDKPALLTHDEVITLFHEFGHGLHHLLTKVAIPSVAGVSGVEWDAVELPSQFMEFWAWQPEGLALISGHIDTGEPLPQEKLDAMLAAKHFQSGMMALRQLEFALFDLKLHAGEPPTSESDIYELLSDIRTQVALLPTPEYNRFASSFGHIFAGGYAAGYYSYKWAELLASDAFDRFESEGVFNAQTGQDFKKAILEVGGSLPALDNFTAFRGRAPRLDAMLRHAGWTDEVDV